jgi:hypothetical protein
MSQENGGNTVQVKEQLAAKEANLSLALLTFPFIHVQYSSEHQCANLGAARIQSDALLLVNQHL